MRIFMHKRERFQTCYEKQIRATGSKGEKRAGKMGNGYENLQDMGKEEMRRTGPYFLIPEWKLGLLQTPQSFYNQDLFQFNLYAEKGIPNEQDFFSREINLLRNATNTAAYTGSNTVILREALEKCSCAIK